MGKRNLARREFVVVRDVGLGVAGAMLQFDVQAQAILLDVRSSLTSGPCCPIVMSAHHVTSPVSNVDGCVR